MEPKVSVIIPVYNAEKYLRQCLDSVVNQSLREIEIICVDDGSTDGSTDILLEYAARDERIRVAINDENLHAGPCRNRGLKIAIGEYILFLDADDWLIGGSLSKIYDQAHKHCADVIRCRALDYDNKTGKISHGVHNYLKKIPFFLFDKVLDFKSLYFLFPKITVAPWGGLCRRQFLLDNGIAFNSLICVNDRSFFWETIIKAKKIILSNIRLLNYRVNIGNSLIGSRIKHFDCHFKSYEFVYKLTEGLPKEQRRCILNGELLDMAHWLEVSANTENFEEIKTNLLFFFDKLDRSIWDGKITKMKWFKRSIALLESSTH